MSASRTSFLFLCTLFVVSARRSMSEPEDVQDEVVRAQCTSRCLSLHMTQLTAALRHLQSDQVLVWCESHRRCLQCLQPCKELWESRTLLPPKACEKQTECITSWEFLASLRSSRQGDCPSPQRAVGFAAACVESCSSDQHCPSYRKCCSNGCGHTCQAPANLYKGVPLKPRREISFTEDFEANAKVGWVSKFNISMEPVIYILQSRWNIGIHPSEDHASPWFTAAKTLSVNTVLSDLRPQRWYQFRVAAVNSHGTRGFTTPSKHYMSNKDPSPPQPPINIRVSNQTIKWAVRQIPSSQRGRSKESEATVAILLNWEPPREGDLPVHNYRITWTPQHMHALHKHVHTLQKLPHTLHKSKQRRRTHSHRQEESRKESNSLLTQGAQSELWLQGLLPATSYSLSIQTVAYWGQKRLKSHRTQLIFSTISYPDEDFSNELPISSPILLSPSFSVSSSPSPHVSKPESSLNTVTSENLRLEAAAPHYHHNQLQVKVFWKWPFNSGQTHEGPYILRWQPYTCSNNITRKEKMTTVQGTHHTIKGLHFSCKYRVTVAPKAAEGSEVVAWVTTPSCSSIKSRDGKLLVCDSKECLPSGKKVLLRPEGFVAEFLQVNETLLTMFRWRMSHHAISLEAVEGFQFTWSLLSQPSTVAGTKTDGPISQTQTIAPSQRSVMVRDLQAASVYRLELQVLMTGGRKGAAVSKMIHTPVMRTDFS